MCSGRVNRGKYPWMTRRSKQWYTNSSRLPNSLLKRSIGRLLLSLCVSNKMMGQMTDGVKISQIPLMFRTFDCYLSTVDWLTVEKFQIFLPRT